MSTVIAQEITYQISNLIILLEAQIPANPEAPKNLRLSQNLASDLKEYFRKLERAFPYSKVASLYNKYVQESLGSETSGFLDPLLASFDQSLELTVNGHLTDSYLSGSAEMITWGTTKGGIPIAYEGPPMKQAVDWAKKEGAKLVTDMDQTTKERLARVISDGIKNKRGIPGIARDIRTEFSDMSKYRSQLIAKTETRKALFQASHDRSVEMGITGKEWVLGSGGVSGENCDDCLANAAAKVIPINDTFPTPEGSIHPGCTCSIAPAMIKK